jgi:protein disulfide isomerase family A protein 3
MLKTALVFIAIAAVRASDVLELGDSDFASKLANIDLALVKFYAPWCGHCKKLAPEFDAASSVLKNDDNPVALVKVDCTADGKETCNQYDVKGFPTLKAFKNGEMAFEYNGPREADGIVKYMRSKAGPVSKALESVAAAEKFFGGAEAAVGGFFESADSDAAKEFQKLASALSEDFRFAHTSDAAVLDKYGYKDNVVIFRPKKMASKFEESEVKFEGDIKLSALKTWVNNNIHGLAGQRTTANQEQFVKPLVTVYYEVDYVKNAKGTNYWRNRVMKVAKKLSEDLAVTFAVANANDFSFELQEFNLDFKDKPVVAAKDAKEQKFIMKDEFSMDSLEAFVKDFMAGKIEPYLKSEPVPEDNSDPVKVVVAKNFEQIVNDPERDVLIEFYAPWCGHCKNLAPKYDELAAKLSDDPTVTIAKMDATANDVPATYNVRGFPTIYYAPKNSKDNPKKYEGGREVADFLKYLAKESTDGLKGYNRDGKKKKKEEL